LALDAPDRVTTLTLMDIIPTHTLLSDLRWQVALQLLEQDLKTPAEASRWLEGLPPGDHHRPQRERLAAQVLAEAGPGAVFEVRLPSLAARLATPDAEGPA
ncbi:MAG: hypothetical protein P1P87_03375, partial [Trueperaceae bacterium]|nr:hypothetical protein [Trueperaceae bacterium]